MTMFRKSMHWLGLGPDDDYDYDEDYDAGWTDAEHAAPVDRVVVTEAAEPAREVSARPVMTMEPEAPLQPARRPSPQPVPAPVTQPAAMTPRPLLQTSEVAMHSNPVVVNPSSFDQAQEVADTFKNNQPVIVNLTGAERDLSRRLIDFASGLCYGLGGHMEKVANQVYLLTPADVTVSAEQRRRLRDGGLPGR